MTLEEALTFVETSNTEYNDIEQETHDDDDSESEPTPTPESESTPEETTQVETYTLTRENNDDFAALLDTYIPKNHEVSAFVRDYDGRKIEFDGHVFMSARKFDGMSETPPTMLHVFFWNGDSEDAIITGDHHGPMYFMSSIRTRDFPLIGVEDANVRVVATIDGVGYMDRSSEGTAYIILTPISIERR